MTDQSHLQGDSAHSFGRRFQNDEPGHLDGCMVQMIEKDGEEVLGVCRCADGCPHLARAIERGQQLAKEHGW